ncbi:MAG: 3,4-dihydroxy-2-butanone-4-phosphate synthase, partial [Nitrososphaerales archaeon]
MNHQYSTLMDAILNLRQGRFVLIHDFSNRENETDMVIAAQYVTPDHIKIMRKDAGGLICVAIRYDIANKLGLPYMLDILDFASKNYSNLSELIKSQASYGKSAF